MLFVYKPEGADPKKWPFDPNKMMSPEAEAIERLCRMTYVEWTDSVQRGSVTALHGLLYVMLKRENPTLKWDEVQFAVDEVDMELDDEETRDVIAALEARAAVGELPAADADVLESLRAQVAEDSAPKED